jgi:hypothetical protein
VAYSGHIYYVDSEVGNVNAGYVKNITMNFMLESGLPKGLFFNADFGAVPGTVSECYIYDLGAASEGTKLTSCSVANTNGVAAMADNALKANTWYSLKVIVSGNKWTANQVVGPIKLSTTSLALGTANVIVYDMNNAGPLLAVGADPSSTDLELKHTPSEEATKADPGATVTSTMEIKTKSDYASGGVYVLTIKDAKFSFESDPAFLADKCKAEETSCVKSVKPDGFKVLKVNGQKVEITATKIVKDNVFFLTLKVKNSVGASSAIAMDVELMTPNKNQVVAKASLTSLASVTAPKITQEATLYHWGVEARAGDGLDRAPIGLYFSATTGANAGVVNSVALKFKSAKALPATKHKVTVKLSDKITPLQGSYSTNLPAASGASLGIKYGSNSLVISNVGAISADSSYTLALRCVFKTAATKSADAKGEIADFGKVTINVALTGDASVAGAESDGAAAPAVKHNAYKKVADLPTQVFNVATTAASKDGDFDALKTELIKAFEIDAAGYMGLRTDPTSSNKGLLILIGQTENLAKGSLTDEVVTAKDTAAAADKKEQATALAMIAPKTLVATANLAKGVGAFQKFFGATTHECFDATNLVLNDGPVKGATCTGYAGTVANEQKNGWVAPSNKNYINLEYVCRNAGTVASGKKFNSICTGTTASTVTTTKGSGALAKSQGIVLPEVVMGGLNAPTQYASAQVLEFPMALIQADNAATSWTTEPAFDLTRLIQTFIITGKTTQADVRTGLVNVGIAKTSSYTNTGKRVPVLARLGGKGAVAGTAFTAFFNQVELSYINGYDTWTANTYPCVMMGATDATCDMGVGAVGDMIPNGFWQFGSWVRVNKPLKNDAVVTAYAPVGYKNPKNDKIAKASSIFTMANGASNSNGGVYLDSGKINFSVKGVEVIGTYTTAAPAEYDEAGTTDYVTKTSTDGNAGILDTNTWVKPGNAPTSAVAKAAKVTLSGVFAKPSATDGYGQATVFVAKTINIWSGVTAKYKTNDNSCGALTYTAAAGKTAANYCLVCYNDDEEMDGDVNLTGIKVPTIWGGSAPLKNYLQTATAGASGILAYIKMNKDNNAANSNNGCTLGALTGVKHVAFSYGSFKVGLTKKTTLVKTSDTLVVKLTVSGDQDTGELTKPVTDVTGLSAASTMSGAVYTVTMTAASDNLEVKDVTVSGVFAKGAKVPKDGTYKADVFIGGTANKIDECTSATAWKGTTVSDANKVVTGTPDSAFAVKTKNIPQTFGTSFGTSSFTTWMDSQYTINFGSYLDASKGLNQRCVPLASDGTVSDAFKTVNDDSLKSVKVVLAKPISSARLRCYGVMPLGTGTDKFSVAFGGSSDVGTNAATTNPAFTGFTTNNGAATTLSVTVTKTQTIVGFSSEYKLVVKVAADQAAGASCLRVAFSDKVAPRLNSYGRLTCLQGATKPVPVNCMIEKNTEGVIHINPNGALKKDSADGYTFHIVGVTLAAGVSTGDKIFVSLMNTANNQAIESAEKTDVAVTTDKSAPLAVSSMSAGASAPTIRSTSTYTYTLTLPAAVLTTAGTTASVYLPANLMTNENTGVSVSIYRSDDTAKANLVDKTTKTNFNRVDLTMKADSANSAAKDYVVTVSGVPTPSKAEPLTYPAVAFKKETTYHATLPGTNNAKLVQSVAGSYQVLDWNSQLVMAYVGYWNNKYDSNKPEAFIKAHDGAFKGSSALTVGGDTASVKTSPESPRVTVGKTKTSLLLAAPAATDAALYSLSFTKADDASDATFSPIPNLRVLVKNDKCSVTVPGPVSVPAGSNALPSIINLDNCFPHADLTIKASLTDPNAKTDAKTDTKDDYAGKITVEPKDGARAVKYAAGKTSYNAFWTVGCSDKQLAAKNDAGKLYWSLDGTNKGSFSLSSPSTSINVAKAATSGDVTAKVSSATPAAGKVTILAQCSKPSVLYWTLDQDKSGASPPSLDTVKKDTFEAGLTQTALPSNGLRISGYAVAATEATDVTITVEGVLAAGTDYIVHVYCQSPVGGNSQADSKKWAQTANGGKPVLITFKASATITDEENDKLTCGTAKTLALPANRVFSILGKTCSSLTTTTTTSGSSRLLNTDTTTYNEQTFVSVSPDRFAAADNSYTTITTAVGQSTFTSSVKTAGGSGLTLSPTASATSTLAADAPRVTLTVNDADVTETSANVEVVVDPSGNYYVALLASSVTAPSKENLIAKVGSDGIALDKYQSGYAADKTAKKISFTGLIKNTKYKAYATAATVAPPSSVVSATVSNKEFTTKNAYALSMALFAMIALFGFAVMM